MLIGICGGICSGKKTVAKYLIDHHGFELISLNSPSTEMTYDELSLDSTETPLPELQSDRDGRFRTSELIRPSPPDSRNGTTRSGTPRTETTAYSEYRAAVFGACSEPDSTETEVVPSFARDERGSQRSQKKKKKKKKNNNNNNRNRNQELGRPDHCDICWNKGHWVCHCPHPNHENSLTINTVNGIPVQDPPGASSVSSNVNSFKWGSNSAELSFSTADSLLEYVTARWQSNFVMVDVHNEAILDQLSRRPFFMLISVDAPVTVRHARFRTLRDPSTTLESFALASDTHLYDPQDGLQPLIFRATVRLLNTSSSLAHLYATLGKLKLADPVRLRPNWDAYFMSLATLASLRSNCMKRRVGAVLVGREKRVISTGYNGTPRGIQNCSDGGCPRCNSGESSGTALSTCLCIHAEENALLEAGRERIREGAVLYCDTCPCLTCSIKICQVGIGEVVYAQGYSMDDQTAAVFRQAGVELRQYIPPRNGLIHLENLNK